MRPGSVRPTSTISPLQKGGHNRKKLGNTYGGGDFYVDTHRNGQFCSGFGGENMNDTRCEGAVHGDIGYGL